MSASPQSPATPDSHDLAARQRSLNISIVEGCAWSVMNGVGERYVPAYVVLNYSGLFPLAAIAALPSFLGAIVQCFAADLTDRLGKRRPIFVWAALLQSFLWLPMIVAIWVGGRAGYALMLTSFLIQLSLQNVCLPPWASLMGDLVPPNRRGHYFGIRNLLGGGTIMASYLAGGYWLSQCQTARTGGAFGMSALDIGFAVLFFIAWMTRLTSAWLLSRMYEPPYHRAASDHFTLADFVRRMPHGNFGRMVFFTACLYVGIGFLNPYLGWYLLEGLHYSAFDYAATLTVQLVTLFGTQWFWGRLADRLGNKRVLSIGAIGWATIPLLLLVSDRFIWLAFVQALDGFANAAWQIAALNYMYDIVTPPKRARCIAYYNLFLWTGFAVGAFAAAAAATWTPLPIAAGALVISHPFGLILIGAAIARFAAIIFLLGSFAEIRVPHQSGEATDPGPA